ncbi:tetratricopeptide repeat protein [Hymenobacter armeniacus]|uniref:Tetratricopeptide repeat protein n=1 Tax=Hymenobacter armeniacus TaxID=2771358 RepID=A0ABR8JM75_9BACT|nr:hypothetical protein [Hymenobacter armeniacus]MBD2721102.1 hypothetical protein [Hymenobacter armeniacus]
MRFGFFLARSIAALGLLGALVWVGAAPAAAQGNVLKSLNGPARRLLRKGQFAALLPEVEQHLRQDSLNADLWALRAECHLNENTEAHAALALVDLNKALRLQPNTWAYLADRGFANSQTFRNAESVADLTAALQQTPADASLLYLRGYGQLATNHLPEAIGDFAQANTLAPQEKDYALWLTFAQMVAGRDADALRTANALVSQNKRYNLAYASRALVRCKLHDAAGARQDADEANRLSSDSTTQFVSAVLYEKTGDAAKAEQLYAQLQAQYKGKGSLLFERGDLYLQFGEVSAAEIYWRQAAALGNKHAMGRLAAGFKAKP